MQVHPALDLVAQRAQPGRSPDRWNQAGWCPAGCYARWRDINVLCDPNSEATPSTPTYRTNTPPFSARVVNVGVRDSTYVLDGLLHHESDLRIEERYTDTAGFTDHVFGLMHLLGFRFAPRIRDLGDTKLFVPKSDASYDALTPA